MIKNRELVRLRMGCQGAIGTGFGSSEQVVAWMGCVQAYAESAMLPAEYENKTFHGLKPVVVVRGKVVGMWTREVKKNVSILEFLRLEKWSKTTSAAVSKEGKRYLGFY